MMAFEQVKLYLREQNVIALTKACLHRIHILTTYRHGWPSPRALLPANVNV